MFIRLSVRDVPVTVLDENEHQTSSWNSNGVTPCGGAKYRWDRGV